MDFFDWLLSCTIFLIRTTCTKSGPEDIVIANLHNVINLGKDVEYLFSNLWMLSQMLDTSKDTSQNSKSREPFKEHEFLGWVVSKWGMEKGPWHVKDETIWPMPVCNYHIACIKLYAKMTILSRMLVGRSIFSWIRRCLPQPRSKLCQNLQTHLYWIICLRLYYKARVVPLAVESLLRM